MKRFVLGCALALAACDDMATVGRGSGGGGGGSVREYMVIGNSMTFEQCRSAGGLIIRDANTAMVACDPSIKREPVPADEFNHPNGNVAG